MKILHKHKQENGSLWHNLYSFSSIMPIATAFLIILIFQIINPAFLSSQGRVTLVYSMSYFLIVACGLTLVIMMGSFDFSVVSVMKLSALICVLYIGRFGYWVIPLSLAISMFFGFINGVLFAKLRIPSFMATLGISVVLDGISLLISRGFLHIMNDQLFRSLAVTFFAGLPTIFYWAIAFWFISTFLALATPFGRRIYAIGGNAKAAALSGINIDRYRIIVFIISGFMSGLAGILYIAQLGGASSEMGEQLMIPLFASVVAGGTALKGGVGGPHRTLIGVVIITWIQAGVLMMGAGRGLQVALMGVIAIVMTLATVDRRDASNRIVK